MQCVHTYVRSVCLALSHEAKTLWSCEWVSPLTPRESSPDSQNTANSKVGAGWAPYKPGPCVQCVPCVPWKRSDLLAAVKG